MRCTRTHELLTSASFAEPAWRLGISVSANVRQNCCPFVSMLRCLHQAKDRRENEMVLSDLSGFPGRIRRILITSAAVRWVSHSHS